MAKKITEFENGAVGKMSIGGAKTANLSFFEILVNGRKFVCNDRSQTHFEEWLSHLPQDVIDLTFLHSVRTERMNNQKKRGVPSDKSDKKRTERRPVCYNCTVKASKDEARVFFEDKRQRLKEIVKILLRVYMRSLQKSQTGESDAYQFLEK